MDYAGIDARNLRFAVNRPLTAAEENQRLDVSASVGVPARSGLSVIRFSSTCLELVDRWYPVKGFNVWLSVMGALAFVPTSSYLFVNLILLGEHSGTTSAGSSGASGSSLRLFHCSFLPASCGSSEASASDGRTIRSDWIA